MWDSAPAYKRDAEPPARGALVFFFPQGMELVYQGAISRVWRAYDRDGAEVAVKAYCKAALSPDVQLKARTAVAER